jgi:perosamine synthetase
VIPYGRQSISQEDLDAVADVLRGDWLTQGPAVDRFEDAVAEYVGTRFAVAFSSGTAALHGAAAAAGLGPGDVVVTSALTFMASANCARYMGAEPTVVDIDPATWNIDLDQVPEDAAAVVPVHYAGLPVDLSRFDRGSRVIIEDAAHALGALTPDGPVGNCAHSDMCCFSTHPVKPITTGEGGLVTTNDEEFATRLRRFRSHGIIRRPENGDWFYDITEIGFNYRMTDIQAALGLSQLARLDEFIRRRNEIALNYRSELADLPVGLPPAARDGYRHGYHLFPVTVENRSEVFRSLREHGVGVQVHYVPIHHHPISSHMGLGVGDLPVCDGLYQRLLSLPIHPGLSGGELSCVIEAIKRETFEVGGTQ